MGLPGTGRQRCKLIIGRSIVDPLQNEQIQVDFKPLFQCIHVYEALDCRSELQRHYQEDRKVKSCSPGPPATDAKL